MQRVTAAPAALPSSEAFVLARCTALVSFLQRPLPNPDTTGAVPVTTAIGWYVFAGVGIYTGARLKGCVLVLLEPVLIRPSGL